MLALVNLWSIINMQLPKVSYVKAVDQYFMVSFTFILLSLLEYTIVMNTDFRRKKDKQKRKDRKISVVSRHLLSPIIDSMDALDSFERRSDDRVREFSHTSFLSVDAHQLNIFDVI